MKKLNYLMLPTAALLTMMISGCAELDKLLQPPTKSKPVQQEASLPPKPEICTGVTDAQAMQWLHQDKYNAENFPECRWSTFWEVQYVYKTPLYLQGKAYCDQGVDYVPTGGNCRTLYNSAITGDTSNQIRRLNALNAKN